MEERSVIENVLLCKLVVVLPVYRELPSLSEGFGAVAYSTREWLLACVSVLVLL